MLVAGVAVSAYFAFDAMRQAKRAQNAADGEAEQRRIAQAKEAEARAEAKRANDNKKLADEQADLATKEAKRADAHVRVRGTGNSSVAATEAQKFRL